MQISKSGNLYKASRITGPTHNFLGLALEMDKSAKDIQIEEVAVRGANCEGPKLNGDQVLEKVLEGVARANEELATDYHVRIMQFAPSDSSDLDAYVILAQRITEEAAKTAVDKATTSHGGAVA